MTSPANPSVPPYRRKPLRPLADHERAALHRVADALIPGTDVLPAPSQIEELDRWLERALAAQGDALESILATATALPEVGSSELHAALGRLSVDDPAAFHALSSTVAGAYLMIPSVRGHIGYPGQRRHPPQFDEAANQIMDGILDPVLERGSIYTPAG
jgi:hypothetical protein